MGAHVDGDGNQHGRCIRNAGLDQDCEPPQSSIADFPFEWRRIRNFLGRCQDRRWQWR